MLKITFSLLYLSWLTLAQAQQLHPDVLASAGTSMNNLTNTARLSFTIGEVAISGASLPSYSYGQGFHNGAIQTVRVTDLDLAVWGIEVWPNPVAIALFLQFRPRSTGDFLVASVWNLLGQPVTGAVQLDDFDQKSIVVAHLPTGVYLLRLSDPSGKSAAIKFVKAD